VPLVYVMQDNILTVS